VRLDAAEATNSGETIAAAAATFLAASCGTAESCAHASATVGDIMTRRKEWGAALTHYSRATREAPTEDRWLRLANAASNIGAHAQAAEALQRVARLRGHADLELKKRIDAEQAAALGQTPSP